MLILYANSMYVCVCVCEITCINSIRDYEMRWKYTITFMYKTNLVSINGAGSLSP